MGHSLVTIIWEDYMLKRGAFSFKIDESYDDGIYAEILAFVQDLLDASSAKVHQLTVARVLDISTLTSNTAVNTGTYDRIDDQAVLAWRSAINEDIKLSIPAPELLLFMTTGSHAEQDVDPDSALMADPAIITTGEVILVSLSEGALTYRKGWRKGQKHS